MRFLFTLHNFLPEPTFGAEEVCIQQMKQLLKLGHTVGLYYSCNSEASPAILESKGLKNIQLYRRKILDTRAQVLLSAWKPRQGKHFAQVIDNFSPDVIIFHHLVRLSLDLPMVARRKGVPSIYYMHDYYPVCPSYSLLTPDDRICSGGNVFKCPRCLLGSRLNLGQMSNHPLITAGIPFMAMRSRLINRLEKDIDLCISPSHSLLQEHSVRGFTPANSMILPYPRPVTNGKPMNCTSRNSVRFGFLGNPRRKKGIHHLTQAFSNGLSDSLVIRGFPNELSLESFKRLFPNLRARLELFNSDRSSFYNNVDVVVVPSIWLENQPMVIIEAFQHGKPVICSDLGGMPEMVEHDKSGLIYRAGDPEDLREKAGYLARNPSEVARLAASIPAWPTVEEHVDRLLAAIRSIS